MVILPESLPVPKHSHLPSLWAKSPARPGETGETLVEHTARVLCRLADQRRLRPGLECAIGEPSLWRRLFWAAFLHDFGKVAAGFQRQVKDGIIWGWRHEALSLAFVPWVVDSGSEDQRWIASAIASHHRDESEIHERYDIDGDPEETEETLRSFAADVDAEAVTSLRNWIRDSAGEWAVRLGFGGAEEFRIDPPPRSIDTFRAEAIDAMREGLSAYFRWRRMLEHRSSDDPIALAPLLLRGLLVTADHAGSAHAVPFASLPLPNAPELLAAMSEEWHRKGRTTHPHQREAAGVRGSVMLIAPTGSGKTESSLLWAANQRDDTGIPPPRLFYVLPYQASMNAMRDRLAQRFGEAHVGLEHGKALHALYRRHMESDPSPRAAAHAARTARSLTRLRHPPIRVLSPYQLLKAFHRLRGYEASIADMHGGLFILDEIHAYEAERLAIILSMMGRLSREFEARFCLMSATFPDMIRRVIAEQIDPLKEVAASPETQAAFERHFVRLAPGDLTAPDALRRIQARAAEGRSVLVCCNTVSRAQNVHAALGGLGLSPELLHSRFNARDRIRKETLLQNRMGTGTVDTDRRMVMVATQVVEVSLDIDFDALFTDPAPLDALLQRFGRVNRAREGGLREVVVFMEPILDRRPYAIGLLRGAMAVLTREFGETGGALREDRVTEWLNEIYSGETAVEWEERYRRARCEFEEAALSRLFAFQTDENLEHLFYRAFDGTEVLPAVLEEEYHHLLTEEPLSAGELLVPIRWGQLGRLRREGRASRRIEEDGTFVADCPYGETLGLEL